MKAFFKARELFAHQRILMFWFVALIALALPWLWFAFTDREPVVIEASTSAQTSYVPSTDY
jgi:hypothetical protein